MRVGVISDTHGLLRPEAVTALQGVDHILHIGDVGDSAILEQLAAIAPLTAIRGNIDRSGPCAKLPETEAIELGGYLLYMVHALEDLDVKPETAGIHAVLYGHSHKPWVEKKNGVLYLNPGSAGPRRFALPITLAFLDLEPDGLDANIVLLIPSPNRGP